MSWIKMRTELARDGRVVRMAARLKASRTTVVGACFILWALADEITTDGLMHGYDGATIDALVDLPGFSSVMVAEDWLRVEDLGVRIPRFGEHNGATAKARSGKSLRQAAWRAKVSVVDGGASTPVDGAAPTREEKRREEERREEEKNTIMREAGGQSPASPSPKVPKVIWNDSKFDGVTDEDKRAWSLAYPACDIDLCLLQMGEWLRANPTKARRSNWRRFITNWLTRQQDQGGTRNGTTRPIRADQERAAKRAREYPETDELPVLRFGAGGLEGLGT